MHASSVQPASRVQREKRRAHAHATLAHTGMQAQATSGPAEEAVDDGPKQYAINITKRNKDGRKPVKGDKVRVNYTV